MIITVIITLIGFVLRVILMMLSFDYNYSYRLMITWQRYYDKDYRDNDGNNTDNGDNHDCVDDQVPSLPWVWCTYL